MMRRWLRNGFLPLLLVGISTQAQDCKRPPEFIAGLGFDPGRSALSSQERRIMGVSLIQYVDVTNPALGIDKTYQDPSWKSAGFVSSISRDDKGNAYVLPSPKVNTLSNSAEDQNTVHIIDSKSGKMSPFVGLPMPEKPHMGNAYGLMGGYMDCEDHGLFVSTIAGSTRDHEYGKVYYIDLDTKKTEEVLSDRDVMGLASTVVNGKKYLLYGTIRDHSLWMVELDDRHIAKGAGSRILSLEDLGPRGDDVVRKIQWDPRGQLVVYGVPFYYNLTAPVVRRESKYFFQKEGHSWKLVGIQ